VPTGNNILKTDENRKYTPTGIETDSIKKRGMLHFSFGANKKSDPERYTIPAIINPAHGRRNAKTASIKRERKTRIIVFLSNFGVGFCRAVLNSSKPKIIRGTLIIQRRIAIIIGTSLESIAIFVNFICSV